MSSTAIRCLGTLFGLCLVVSDAAAQFAVHADVEYFTWREHTSPIEVKEAGPRYAIGAGYMQPKSGGFLLAASGRVYAGGVDYDGSFQFDVTEAARGTSNYLGANLGAQLRHRWPGLVDAVTGLEFDTWNRRLSASQQEDYRILSGILGLEYGSVVSSRFILGGGVRFLLLTDETTTLVADGFRYELELTPGLGSNPFLKAGYRMPGRVTLLAFWDGMRLGRSNEITLIKRGRPAATVTQPPTDVDRVGFRISYGW